MRFYLESDQPLPRLTAECRIDVFATHETTVGKGKRQRTVTRGVGWQGWNPCPSQEQKHARLTGSGSFYWPGALSAYAAARQMMRTDATIHQVKIETIGGREIGRIYR